jgi:hypothetical protein
MSGASMPPMGGSLTITPALVSEMVSYAQAQNIQPPPTPAQAQAIANHLIFKNLAPPGTTGTQLSAAMESQPDMNAPENQNLRDKAQSDNFIKDSKKDPKGQLFVDSTTGLAIGFIESNGEGGCYSSTYSETLQKCYDAKSAALDRLYSNERR